MSNQLLNEAGMYGPAIKVDNQGTESEMSSSCQLQEFAINDVFDFGPSDLQKMRPQFVLLNGFSVYPLG